MLVGAVALGGLHPSDAFAAQHPSLPAKTPAQLLTAVQESGTQALSGTVTETAHWGLPSLPGGTDSASLDWQGLLTGSHTLRVAAAGPDRQRVAVLGSLSESDVVHNGNGRLDLHLGDELGHPFDPAQPGQGEGRHH